MASTTIKGPGEARTYDGTAYYPSHPSLPPTNTQLTHLPPQAPPSASA